MAWEVSKTNLPYLILVSHTLSQIGCDNEAMLAAVCDRNDGVVTLNGENEYAQTSTDKQGRVAALQAEMFETLHSSGGDEYDAVDDESLYIDLPQSLISRRRIRYSINAISPSFRTRKQPCTLPEAADIKLYARRSAYWNGIWRQCNQKRLPMPPEKLDYRKARYSSKGFDTMAITRVAERLQ